MDNRGESDSRDLLRRFAGSGDEAAFQTVVERHAGMVHGVALRRTGDPDTAEEVAQRVFISLARKAERVAALPSAGAWLHRAAVLETLKVLREQRRSRERLAMITQQMSSDEESNEAWRDALPHLDDAFDRLKEGERAVLMMRYVEGRTFSEVGASLSVSAEAARKRSERALERLGSILRRRGVAVPTAVLASVLTAEFAKAAPTGLTGAISAAATSAPASAATTSLWQPFVTAMQSGKLTMAAAVLVGAAIPIGIEVANGNQQRSAAGESSGGSASMAASGSKRLQARAPSTSTTEERLRDVFARLEAGEEMDADLELAVRRLVFTLDAAELETARELLGEVGKVDRFQEIAQAVFARWAEIDAEAAVAEASREIDRFGYYPLHGAFGTWTVTDRDAALDWLVAASTPFDLKFMGYEWLRRTVTNDAEEAVEILEELAAGKPEWSDTMHWALVDWWAKHDAGRALAWVDQFEGDLRQQLLGHFVRGAGSASPPFALRAAEEIENRSKRLEAVWEVVWWWALEQPDELIRYASAHDTFESLEPETLRAIGEGLARNRPGEAVALGEQIDEERRRDSFWSGVLRGVTEAHPERFVAAAEAISEDYVEREASGDFTMFVRSWFERDAEAARAWVEELPEGPKRRFASMAAQLGVPLRATE